MQNLQIVIYICHTQVHIQHIEKFYSVCSCLKIRRNCLNNSDLSKRCEEYKRYLMFQDYPKSPIEKEFDKALKMKRKDLLHVKVKPKRKVYPFVTEFNPRTPNISQIISKHMHLISTSELKENFPNKSITAYTAGVENVSDHGTNGPRKFLGLPENIQKQKRVIGQTKKFLIGRKYTELDDLLPLYKYLQFTDGENNQFLKKCIMIIN